MKKHRLLITLLLVAVAAQTTLADEIKIVGQNVQNFFYSLDRGRTKNNGVSISNYSTVAGRTAKLDAIINALSQYHADIYAFNEIEVKVAGSAANEDALVLLAQAMSTKTGKSYVAVADDQTYDLNSDPDGAIRSGFIYNSATIETVGENVSTAIGYNNIYPATMRMQVFKSKASGEMFTLSMNHFKASTSADVTEDIQKREGNSISLLKGLDQATIDPDILVLGDLNSEVGEQCLNNLVDAGYEEQILKRHPTDVSHWYNYIGNLIDHTFANSTMAAQVTDARIEYVANKHSVGNNAYSDHDPYLITLNLNSQPAAKYGFKKATSFSTGVRYLFVVPVDGLQVADHIPTTGKYYGNHSFISVSENDDIIAMDDLKSSYIFEDKGDDYYYMKDYYGRYNYQSGTYTTTTTGDKQYVISSNCKFNVIKQDNGTFKILNETTGYYLLSKTSDSNFSWHNWKTLYSGQYIPWLYEYDPSIITGIETVSTRYTQPTMTRKVMLNGRLVIVTPDGSRYNMQGIELR